MKTCASESTNCKGWAAARDEGNGASRDEGYDEMSSGSTWPLHLKGGEMRSPKSKAGTKRQVHHELDRKPIEKT